MKKKIEKINFTKIKDVLSRYEMRSIMAGSGGGGACGGCQSPINPSSWAYCVTTGSGCTCIPDSSVTCHT